MNWVDITIIVVLALSVLVGLWRGLISEVLALLVWIAAFWVAYLFGADVAAMFAAHIELYSARMVLGYGLCFVSVLIVGALLGFVMHKLVQSTGLSGSDRLLGMFFGLARGLFLVTLAVLLLGFTPFPGDPWWHQSRLLPGFQGGATWLGQRLPDGLEKYLSYAPKIAAALKSPQGTAQSSMPAAARSVESKKVVQDRF